jgi:hypothetical protein
MKYMLLTLNTSYIHILCGSTVLERGKSQTMLNTKQTWCRHKYEFNTSYTKAAVLNRRAASICRFSFLYIFHE